MHIIILILKMDINLLLSSKEEMRKLDKRYIITAIIYYELLPVTVSAYNMKVAEKVTDRIQAIKEAQRKRPNSLSPIKKYIIF